MLGVCEAIWKSLEAGGWRTCNLLAWNTKGGEGEGKGGKGETGLLWLFCYIPNVRIVYQYFVLYIRDSSCLWPKALLRVVVEVGMWAPIVPRKVRADWLALTTCGAIDIRSYFELPLPSSFRSNIVNKRLHGPGLQVRALNTNVGICLIALHASGWTLSPPGPSLTLQFNLNTTISPTWKNTATMNTQSYSQEAYSPPSQKRQRAKQACEPCRLRKRRCDSGNPCNMCAQFEYTCYYEKHPRKRSKIVETDANLNGIAPPEGNHSKTEASQVEQDQEQLRSMEANSGIAFTRLLGMRLDPSSGPKLFTFGWNLGSGTANLSAVPPVTELISLEQMSRMANVYFECVHPLYGFLDKKWVLEQMVLRWTRPDAVKIPDHMLCGVVALGYLFANEHDFRLAAAIPRLVNAAKMELESNSMMQPPTVNDVASWVLRAMYLRSTDHPHATWMATSITMHLIESLGLHQETTKLVIFPAVPDHTNNAELRRRIFWIARMLNSWVSFEYGRTRVALRGITSALPTPWEGDFTTDFIHLYSQSCCLDPDRSDQPEQLEDFLKAMEVEETRHEGIMLSKANLTLCAFRRLRLTNPQLSSETLNRIITIGHRGLEASRKMVRQGQPWWHVANVPFQMTCVLLAMDTRESLQHVSAAIRTLEEVVTRFPTPALKEALKTARFLIRLSRKKKDEDSAVLGVSLRKDGAEADPHPENLTQEFALQAQQSQLSQGGAGVAGGAVGSGQQLDDTPLTTSSGEDWNLDFLNNPEFDWNYFLTADIPVFGGMAPDGAM